MRLSLQNFSPGDHRVSIMKTTRVFPSLSLNDNQKLRDGFDNFYNTIKVGKTRSEGRTLDDISLSRRSSQHMTAVDSQLKGSASMKRDGKVVAITGILEYIGAHTCIGLLRSNQFK